MLSKSIRLTAVLLVLVSVCLPSALAQQPETQNYSSTQEELPPPVIHSWWNLTPEEISVCYEDGRQKERDGISGANIGFMIMPRSFIDDDVKLESSELIAPPGMLQFAGWLAEHSLKSDDYMQDDMLLTYRTSKKDIRFHVYLTSEDYLNRLTGIQFALETDRGVRVSPIKEPNRLFNVGHTTQHSWFNMNYFPTFPLRDARGRPIITAQTRWIRLWVITVTGRTPITFWVDGSARIELGSSEQQSL